MLLFVERLTHGDVALKFSPLRLKLLSLCIAMQFISESFI